MVRASALRPYKGREGPDRIWLWPLPSAPLPALRERGETSSPALLPAREKGEAKPGPPLPDALTTFAGKGAGGAYKGRDTVGEFVIAVSTGASAVRSEGKHKVQF